MQRLPLAALTKIAEDKIYVTDIKGPLEKGWKSKVESFAHQVVNSSLEENTTGELAR